MLVRQEVGAQPGGADGVRFVDDRRGARVE
jgi:hypothetical protein